MGNIQTQTIFTLQQWEKPSKPDLPPEPQPRRLPPLRRLLRSQPLREPQRLPLLKRPQPREPQRRPPLRPLREESQLPKRPPLREPPRNKRTKHYCSYTLN